jgi:hypothetical protein
MRTGATEALEKLPVHFETTLSCAPHFVIYSDYEEEIQGHKIHDIFDDVSEQLKSLPDFELYRHLKSVGRSGVGASSHLGSGAAGSPENPGWKLDRFKFLPMVEKALRHQPDAKWFMFVEADTHLVWSNLLLYLAQFDASKPYYIGKQTSLGDIVFGHGGSGFVLSKPAAEKLTEHMRAHLEEYDRFTTEQWAGDVVLGKALKDVGIPLLWAFPHFQGDPLRALDHNISKVNRQPWCYPAITYHHMSEEDIRLLWDFERSWTQRNQVPMRHRDVFVELVLPQLADVRTDWDNISTGEVVADVDTLSQCIDLCLARPACMQCLYSAKSCAMSTEVYLGTKATSRCLEYSEAANSCLRREADQSGSENTESVQSGWMMDRLERYIRDLDQTCGTSADVANKWVLA